MTNGRYLPYLEYRESKTDWLGKIPSHWTCVRLKYVADLAGEKIEPGSDHKYVGMENVDSGNGKYIAKEDVTPEGLSTSFSKDDVLFGKLRPYLAKSWMADFCGICSSEFLVLRSKKVSPRFLNYYTLTEGFINQVDSSTYGSKMPRASWDFVGLLDVPVPANESEKIAKFLDHETAKIDTLIEKQQQLIKLLKEKRQAVISHAVTKGLNPNAPMRDSGVEWLGEVPAHWDVLNTKKFFKLVCDPAPDDNDMELLSVYTDIGVRPRKELEARGNKASTTDGYWLVKKDDLIVNKLLAWMGAVGYSAYDGVTSPAYDILRKRRGLNTKFYHYLFRTRLVQSEFKRWSRGIMEMRLRLYFEELGRIPMPFPPESEQDEIVAEIEKLEIRYDEIIDRATNQIELSQGRRTALISAAVTGKIDVRNWQAPSQSNNQKIAA